ncbi:MAG: methyl-accepting chemotaxis protein [Spirochaetales bacterium]|nr:methyl-accepting chemotaxis protein [Spirochaetales bacterium]
MFNRKVFLLGWSVFILPHLMTGVVINYLEILDSAGRKDLYSSPFTWLFVVLLQVVFFIFWFTFRKLICSWREQDSPDRDFTTLMTRKVVIFPKKILYVGLLQSFVLPQLVYLFQPAVPFSVRIHISLVTFACTMFFAMPFYILFLQSFEEDTKDVPFNSEVMSMKLTLRTNLVVFMLMTSVLIVLQMGITYSLSAATVLETVRASLSQKLLPLELVAIVMSVVNIYLLMRGINHRIQSCESFAGELAEGDFSARVAYCLSRDELGALNYQLFRVYRNNAELLKNLGSAVDQTVESKDEMIQISGETSAAMEQISGRIETVYSHMEELNRSIQVTTYSTRSLKGHIEELNVDVEKQNEIVESSSGAITEITASIDSITSVAEGKINSAEGLVEVSREGEEKLNHTMESISRMNDSVEKIKAMLSLIQNIASQTNLLAMNAAIEAAHAGDAGKGFAVVADEIRKLAESSSSSSREIHNNINTIIETIQETSAAGTEAIDSFHQITDGIDDMINSYREIGSGLSELKEGSGLILDSVSSLKDNSARVKSSSTGMEELTSGVDSAMGEIEEVSTDTSRAAEEMRSGAASVKSISSKMIERSHALEEASDAIVKGLNRFKF